MPEESVAAYINNTVTFVIFILICIVVFVLICLISLAIRKKVLVRNPRTSRIDIDVDKRGTGFNKEKIVDDHRSSQVADPFIRKNIALLVFIFIFMILSVIFALAVFYYSQNMGINSGLYVIGTLLLGFLIMLLFISRSGTISK